MKLYLVRETMYNNNFICATEEDVVISILEYYPGEAQILSDDGHVRYVIRRSDTDIDVWDCRFVVSIIDVNFSEEKDPILQFLYAALSNDGPERDAVRDILKV